MTDLTPLKNWCTNIGLLLKQKNQKATDPRNAFNSMLGNVERELKLVEDLAANDKNKKIRVVAELPRYQQRVDHLVKTTGEVALKKLSEDAARKAIEDATRQLTQLHNSIRLARSYADPKLLDEPAIQTLRKESAKMQPVYEDKRGRIEKVIKELTEAGPGAEVQIRELQERLDRAVLLEPDYKGA